jgi:hypothetical protein
MSAAMHRQKGQMPAWLMFSGMAIGVVGASIRKHAESVGEFVVFLGSRTDNSDLAAAVALGRWGLVLLVAGAVVVLAGLVVIPLTERRRAMDPRRRLVARRGLTSASPCPQSRASGWVASERRDICAEAAAGQFGGLRYPREAITCGTTYLQARSRPSCRLKAGISDDFVQFLGGVGHLAQLNCNRVEIPRLLRMRAMQIIDTDHVLEWLDQAEGSCCLVCSRDALADRLT